MLGNKAADATGNEEKEEEKEEEEGVEIGNFRINILLVIPVEETRDVKRIRKKVSFGAQKGEGVTKSLGGRKVRS